jgi:chemotaxis protein histidine kinase CheA
MSGLSSMIGNIVREAIMECGSVHNFDASEMIRNLKLDEMSIRSRSNISKKIVKEKIVKEKVVKEKAVKEKVVKEKQLFPMPFNGLAKENCCSALRPNQGLYTQCEMVVSEPGFCKKCGPDAIYGTIEQRLAVGIMEYRDPKGKAPTAFTKIMKKLKISREDVEEEASKLNIIINDIHFQEEETEKKEKGRPKKARRQIELADDSTDLFAALVAKANENSEEEDNSSSSAAEESAEESVKSVVDSAEEEEKEKVKQEKIQKKAEKLAETQKKEAEKAAEKQALIQKKEAEKAEKEAEKQALIQKKEAEKAEKDAEKQALIQKKEAEKAEKQALIQKKEAEKAEKEAAKLEQTQKKVSVKAKEPNEPKKEVSKIPEDCKLAPKVPVEKKVANPTKKAAKVVEEEEEVPDVVKRFEFEGVKYLKSKNTGIIYNLEQDVIGKWNEKTGKIDFEEVGSEEEEEEYDE